jgi:hypothetical protein
VPSDSFRGHFAFLGVSGGHEMGDYELELTTPEGVSEIVTGDLFTVVERVQTAPPGYHYVIVRLHDLSAYTYGVTAA